MEQEEKNYQPETRSRKFWRVVLGSMVGFVLASMITCILGILMMLAMVATLEKSASSMSSSTVNVKENSVLMLDLSSSISERAVEIPFNFGSYSDQSLGLDNILKAIEAAASDSKIKGIYLKSSTVGGSPATMKAIRDALMEFKKSGKFVYAYNDVYTQNGYYMATAADKILLNPVGDLSIKGYAFQLMFYKNLLDKLDVDVQIFRHGQFKSAVEPYFLDKMSDANREQLSVLANSLWNVYLQDVSKARKISVNQLNNIADSMLCSSPQEALKLKLVDKLAYSDEVEKMMKSKMNLGDNDKINYVTVSQYAKTVTDKDNKAAQKVAVMYAYGEIADGKGDSDRGIYSETFIKEFRKVYKDKDVKAIVLRVNSPGGSALASENIWHEIEAAKKAGKKVVVSMGDYAASGGQIHLPDQAHHRGAERDRRVHTSRMRYHEDQRHLLRTGRPVREGDGEPPADVVQDQEQQAEAAKLTSDLVTMVFHDGIIGNDIIPSDAFHMRPRCIPPVSQSDQFLGGHSDVFLQRTVDAVGLADAVLREQQSAADGHRFRFGPPIFLVQHRFDLMEFGLITLFISPVYRFNNRPILEGEYPIREQGIACLTEIVCVTKVYQFLQLGVAASSFRKDVSRNIDSFQISFTPYQVDEFANRLNNTYVVEIRILGYYRFPGFRIGGHRMYTEWYGLPIVGSTDCSHRLFEGIDIVDNVQTDTRMGGIGATQDYLMLKRFFSHLTPNLCTCIYASCETRDCSPDPLLSRSVTPIYNLHWCT